MLKHIPFYASLMGRELPNGKLSTSSYVLVYGAIEAHSMGAKGCIASNKTIASETGLKENSVQTIISILAKAKWIEVEIDKNNHRKKIDPIMVIIPPLLSPLTIEDSNIKNTVANAPVGAPKEKNETLRLFYLVLKSYGLPVINHNHIKKWAIDLESSLGAEISELYLNRLLERNINDEGLKDRFIPQLTKPMDVLNKSQQIIQYLKRTKNTAPTPVNIDDTLERERLQEEEAKRIREA